VRPPFPALVGLYGKPTLINNVETLTNVPMILANGASWYKAMGTGDSAGVKIFSLSGRVRKPGNYELPFGTTFRQLIYEHGGGILDGRPVKAIMPAGASSAMIVVDDKVLDTPMDYASVRSLGSELGSASVIVIDDTVSMDWIVNKTIHFFKHESCGKCTPCREGTYWMQNITERIHSGNGTQGDVDLLLNVAKQMQGKCLCPLGEFSTMAVVTGIERFPQDFKRAVMSKK
jgi:NADH-quinone oxidoreductase subunit F